MAPSSGDTSTGVPHKGRLPTTPAASPGAAGCSLVPLSPTRSHYAPDVVSEGEPAPDFTATTDTGERVSLSDFRGKPVVLYFYPRDDSPGCTAQACGIRDAYGEFERAGAVVLGISPDDEASHVKFKEKYGPPVHAAGGPGARGRRALRDLEREALQRSDLLGSEPHDVHRRARRDGRKGHARGQARRAHPTKCWQLLAPA